MLIDGNSLLNRAFYGLLGPKMLSNSEGLYTNAVYGFLNILIKLLKEEKPAFLLVAFDMKKPTFRHEHFEKYKAHRKGMPEELAMQVPVIKEVLDGMNIKRFEIEGYEADDIIGTYAKLGEQAGLEIVIVTGDKDALQLASQTVRIKIPTTRMGKTDTAEYDDKEVFNKYGVTPLQFIDVKALMGDPSDNIPGVAGVGEKTALDLIARFDSIEHIYDNIEELDIKPRIKGLLLENKDMAFLSKKLATIDITVPVDLQHCDCELKEYNLPVLLPLFKKLEFNSMAEKLGITQAKEPKQNEAKFESSLVANKVQLLEISEQIKRSGQVAYSLIIDNTSQIEGISFSWQDNKAAYIDLSQSDQREDLYKIVKDILNNKNIKKYAFNAKPHYSIFDRIGIDIKNIDFDVMIAAYLVDPAKEKYNLAALGRELLNIELTDFTDISKINSSHAMLTFKLTSFLKQRLKNDGQEKLYYEIELPLTRVLADMEKEGILVNAVMLDTFSEDLNKKIESLSKDILELAGENFNINSTKQLGAVLFEKLGLPVVRKTKTGYSTDAEVLENLAAKHPIIEKILEYRQMVKLNSTYVEGLKNVISPVDGRIHSNFNQTVTVTGRISSTEPNLQNIPIKLEMGRQIRKVFVAPKGYTLIDADYSQIELRILAHIANDANMIGAFRQNKDIHRKTAAEVFNVNESQVTPSMRSSAKAINFGIVYGIGDFSLAKDLKITRKEAKEYIDNYFANFSGVKKYLDDTVKKAKETGFVSTLLGRRRYVPEITSSNFNIRSFGERIAMNMPIQGTAADIIKMAMVKVHQELKNRNLSSKLILQVHDELIIEAKNEEVEEVKELLRCCMEDAIALNVKLDADIHTGENWYEAK
jgi:DNA polymerase-1